MEMIVAGAIFLLTLVPTPHKTEVLNSPTLHEIAQNVNITQPPVKQIDPSPQQAKEVIHKQQIHVVRAGETLDQISEEHYGSGKYWTSVWNDNPEIKDPRIIIAGAELKIRDTKPTEVEDLNEDLAKLYEEINSPSPTQVPKTTEVAGASAVQIPPAGPTSNFDAIYQAAGSRFGVPWQILYGIHMVETGLRDGAISSGYGTGAQGPMQFMPGTWASYGIDGNADGVIDINNAADAIYGAANYIAAHGGVDTGLHAYGGDSAGMLNAARSRGYNQ